MALFLKYRPQSFRDVVGQESVIKTLQNSIKSNKSAHAYLFSGSRGTGKTSLARIFAKELIGQNIKDEKHKNDLFKQITNGSLVDVIEIDGASNRGIDEIRDLREKINFAPNVADKKIYIIDEVHMLTTQAFNALLKTLEEPPEHAYFLLATTEMHKLPETIVSRCQCFVFHRFTIDQLADRLEYICTQENFSFESEALNLIARKAEGGMRDAVSLLDQIAAETDQNITKQSVLDSLGMSSTETLESFFNALQNKNTDDAFQVLRDINSRGGDFRTFGHDLLSFLREKMHANISNRETLPRLIQYIEETEKAIQKLKTTPIVELPFEIAILNILGIQSEKPINRTPPQKTEDTTKKEISKNEPIQEIKTKTKPVVSKDIHQKNEKKQDAESSTEKKKEDSTDEYLNGFSFENENETKKTVQLKERKASALKTDAKKTEETKTAPKEFTNTSVTERMKLIAEKAELPSFGKQSFLFTKPQCEGTTVAFKSDNKFHIDKLNETIETKNKIQATMTEIFGQEITISFEVIEKPKNTEKKIATADDFSEYFS